MSNLDNPGNFFSEGDDWEDDEDSWKPVKIHGRALYKKAREIFSNDYVYFSSYSKSWVEHARRYADAMVDRFHFDENSLVVEIASNDGYLLQHFKNKGVPVLGVEPTKNTANVAIMKGIPTTQQLTPGCVKTTRRRNSAATFKVLWCW